MSRTVRNSEDLLENSRLSVLVATPIVFVMFVLGTASVVSLHEASGAPINYVAPIPQTLILAFGQGGAADVQWDKTVASLTAHIEEERI